MSLTARIRAAIGAWRQPARFDPQPAPSRPEPTHEPDGSITDVTPLPKAPPGSRWTIDAAETSDSHIDYLTRNLDLGIVRWSLTYDTDR